ncbi:Glycosyltransferase Gtf1 [bioreactor metagenome]|uniref:Glycosyltransferase Gtf1 n=1 Tax=bioreactor metagenome TaxID=1076179 RepID=A0A645AFE6_9ZZZZ
MFQQYGHEVRFVTYGNADFFKSILDASRISVDCIIDSGKISRILKIRKKIREGDQNVVISFLETPNFLACIATIGGREWKLITSERSSNIMSFKNAKGRIFNWFQRFSDAIVCNSKNGQCIWEEHYPMYKDKLLTIYNPVLLPEVQALYQPRKDGKLHIVVAASYQYLKNMDSLIEAVNLLNFNLKSYLRVDWYGRIEVTAGNKEAYNAALEKINRYQLEKIIVLHEETKDINQKMSEADFVGLFSQYEGLPNAICEGMSLGKPIIMTRVSDYNVLVDEKNGFLCDAANPQIIKEAIENAMKLSVEEIYYMGRNSKEKANNLFNKQIIAEKWLNLIK